MLPEAGLRHQEKDYKIIRGLLELLASDQLASKEERRREAVSSTVLEFLTERL
jgi:hypothetical protein